MIQGKRILVIEDEFLIALDIECTLLRAGAAYVALAGGVEEALAQIADGPWDAAVTDVNLQGDNIDAIVEALRARRIPFLLLTGYGRDALPGCVARAPMLAKPFDPQALVAGIGEVCGRSG